MNNLIRKILFTCLFITSIFETQAQRYSGVNLNNIKGKKYKGNSTKEFESFHQFAIGYNAPRSMNFEGDFYWFRNVKDEIKYELFDNNIQLMYSYNWKRWVASLYAMFEVAQTEFNYTNTMQTIRNTFSFGLKYKWILKDKASYYSGFCLGYSVQENDLNYNSNSNPVTSVNIGYGSLQIIALGVNYKFNKFGVFGELGYGTKGLLYAGLFYNI